MTPLETSRLTDRSLIESVVNNFYILDYGYIHKINANGTIDVMHAKRQQTIEGVELPESVTKGLEVLTIGCQEFSLQFTLKTGDQVLLLGLKDYIKSVAEVNKPSSQDAFIHYARNTMKALPLSVFNDDAKVKIQIDGGNFDLSATKITMQGGGTNKNAARKGDQVKVVIPIGSFVTNVAGTGVQTVTKNITEVELTGTIQSGSGSVEIGD